MNDHTIIGFPSLGIEKIEINRFLTQNLFGTGIRIAWYGVIICLGMIAAYIIIRHNATKKEGITVDSLLDYFIFTIPLGVIGARAMYVLTNLDYYDSFKKMISVWNGGLAIYGGVIVGIIVIVAVSIVKKHDTFGMLDAIVPGVMVAQAMGRWGNFINGEAHGGFTSLPWGMTINYSGPFHPTFLYESILTLSGFFIAEFLIYKKRKFKGEVFSFYLIWYGIGRFFIEGMRTDSLYIGSFRASQLIGIASVIAGIGIAVYFLKFANKKADTVSKKANGIEEKNEEKADEK